MTEPYIYCDREIIKCSICGVQDSYSFNDTRHFSIIATEGNQSNGRYSIESIECKNCNKLASNSQDPYFYYWFGNEVKPPIGGLTVNITSVVFEGFPTVHLAVF